MNATSSLTLNVHIKLINPSNLCQNYRRRKYAKPMVRYRVVMIRHGESEFTHKNLFCGWFDAPLTPKGVEEAKHAGQVLKAFGNRFDIAFTSVLIRAEKTLHLILQEMGQTHVKIVQTWRLNDRHYGGLTGLNKSYTANKYGEHQVNTWRRSYDVPPPPMQESHPYYDVITKDIRYRETILKEAIPKFESLKMMTERVLPFWLDMIVPLIKKGQNVFLVGHGNTLRGLIKVLQDLNNQQITKLFIPNGLPFILTLNDNMVCVPNIDIQYIDDPDFVEQAIQEAMGKEKKVKK